MSCPDTRLEAAAVAGRANAPFHLARTELEQARVALARGTPGGARTAAALLAAARARAAGHGCRLVEHRAAALAGPLG